MSVSNPRRRQLLVAGTLAASGLAAHAGSRTPGLTLPADATRLRIAFGSCAKQSKPQPIWQAIGAAHPDLFVFLGDNFYADAQDEATLRKRYEEFRAVETLQAFRRKTPHVAIWDDHDFGDDDVGGDYALKQLSQQLFCDEWGEPADSPRRTRSGVYDSYLFTVGTRRVQLIMMDLRYNRTPLTPDPSRKSSYTALVLKAKLSGQPMKGWYLPNPAPEASMLGEEQWQWLAEQLSVPADVRIFGSSVQFSAEGSGWEGWTNFPSERERLIRLLREKKAEGAVFISGDMHYGEISRWDVAQGYPLWDATSSGLTEVWGIPTPNSRRASTVMAEENFGLLDLDFSAEAPTLQFSLCDIQGQVKIRQLIALDSLRFPRTETTTP